MKTKILLAVAGLLGASQTYGAELCVQPWNPSCFQTIQGAVDAASAHDIIWVHPHPDARGYRENVEVNVKDLTIAGIHAGGGPVLSAITGLETLETDDGKKDKDKGEEAPSCPAQVLSACETTAFPNDCGGIGFFILNTGVTIRNMTIQHAEDAIFVDAFDDATLDHICVIESDDGVDGSGNDMTIANSAFLGIRDKAIEPDGDRMRVKNNFIRTTDEEGIDIQGNDVAVTHNVLRGIDDECIDVNGDRALIAHNSIDGCEDDGIQYDGNDSKILYNEIRNVRDDDEGIDANGDDITVAHNHVDLVVEEGIDVNGNRNRVHHNRVERSGSESNSEPGIEIRGDDNRIWSNVAWKNTFAGIRNDFGNRNHYEDNLSSENGKSGIRINDGDDTVVTRNTLLNNRGEGVNIDNNAARTVVKFNESFGNYRDICNDSATTTFDSNAFKTGGAGTACVVEQ